MPSPAATRESNRAVAQLLNELVGTPNDPKVSRRPAPNPTSTTSGVRAGTSASAATNAASSKRTAIQAAIDASNARAAASRASAAAAAASLAAPLIPNVASRTLNLAPLSLARDSGRKPGKITKLFDSLLNGSFEVRARTWEAKSDYLLELERQQLALERKKLQDEHDLRALEQMMRDIRQAGGKDRDIVELLYKSIDINKSTEDVKKALEALKSKDTDLLAALTKEEEKKKEEEKPSLAEQERKAKEEFRAQELLLQKLRLEMRRETRKDVAALQAKLKELGVPARLILDREPDHDDEDAFYDKNEGMFAEDPAFGYDDRWADRAWGVPTNRKGGGRPGHPDGGDYGALGGRARSTSLRNRGRSRAEDALFRSDPRVFDDEHGAPFGVSQREDPLFATTADAHFFDDPSHRRAYPSRSAAGHPNPNAGQANFRIAPDDPRLDPHSGAYSRRVAHAYLAQEARRKQLKLAHEQEEAKRKAAKVAQREQQERVQQREKERQAAIKQRDHELAQLQKYLLNKQKTEEEKEAKLAEFRRAEKERARITAELEEVKKREEIAKREEELNRLERLLRENPKAVIPGLELRKARTDPDLLAEALRQVEQNARAGAPMVQPVKSGRSTPKLDNTMRAVILDFLCEPFERQQAYLRQLPSGPARQQFLEVAASLAPPATAAELKRRFANWTSRPTTPQPAPVIVVDRVLSPPPTQDRSPAISNPDIVVTGPTPPFSSPAKSQHSEPRIARTALLEHEEYPSPGPTVLANFPSPPRSPIVRNTAGHPSGQNGFLDEEAQRIKNEAAAIAEAEAMLAEAEARELAEANARRDALRTKHHASPAAPETNGFVTGNGGEDAENTLEERERALAEEAAAIANAEAVLRAVEAEEAAAASRAQMNGTSQDAGAEVPDEPVLRDDLPLDGDAELPTTQDDPTAQAVDDGWGDAKSLPDDEPGWGDDATTGNGSAAKSPSDKSDASKSEAQSPAAAAAISSVVISPKAASPMPDVGPLPTPPTWSASEPDGTARTSVVNGHETTKSPSQSDKPEANEEAAAAASPTGSKRSTPKTSPKSPGAPASPKAQTPTVSEKAASPPSVNNAASYSPKAKLPNSRVASPPPNKSPSSKPASSASKAKSPSAKGRSPSVKGGWTPTPLSASSPAKAKVKTPVEQKTSPPNERAKSPSVKGGWSPVPAAGASPAPAKESKAASPVVAAATPAGAAGSPQKNGVSPWASKAGSPNTAADPAEEKLTSSSPSAVATKGAEEEPQREMIANSKPSTPQQTASEAGTPKAGSKPATPLVADKIATPTAHSEKAVSPDPKSDRLETPKVGSKPASPYASSAKAGTPKAASGKAPSPADKSASPARVSDPSGTRPASPAFGLSSSPSKQAPAASPGKGPSPPAIDDFIEEDFDPAEDFPVFYAGDSLELEGLRVDPTVQPRPFQHRMEKKGPEVTPEAVINLICRQGYDMGYDAIISCATQESQDLVVVQGYLVRTLPLQMGSSLPSAGADDDAWGAHAGEAGAEGAGKAVDDDDEWGASNNTAENGAGADDGWGASPGVGKGKDKSTTVAEASDVDW